MFTIIEDCSPYYIRFTHSGLTEIVDHCLTAIQDKKFYNKFTPFTYNEYDSKKLLELTPVSKVLKLMPTRVSLFVTQPGHYYRAHKDGLNHRFSINYTVKILDEACVTNWYSDADLSGYEIDNLGGRSREAQGFRKLSHSPIKSMIAKPNECILFNTDIFHDFDNSTSLNERMVLTFRAENPGNLYFDDAKKLLFAPVVELVDTQR